mmetsp:Transcript_11244/g.39046  ORF Transcript_11244/g.39046 Transcript_11244/m.39046 type:complete len:184 (+) Transcript_11244:56-607(+)
MTPTSPPRWRGVYVLLCLAALVFCLERLPVHEDVAPPKGSSKRPRQTSRQRAAAWVARHGAHYQLGHVLRMQSAGYGTLTRAIRHKRKKKVERQRARAAREAKGWLSYKFMAPVWLGVLGLASAWMGDLFWRSERCRRSRPSAARRASPTTSPGPRWSRWRREALRSYSRQWRCAWPFKIVVA